MDKPDTLKPEILAVSKRNNTIETIHYGWICVLDKDKKIVYKKGNILNETFLRSAAKPIQAIPILDSKLNISQEELAIACGSHTGSSKHLKVLKNLLKEFNIKLSDLKCGIHSPFDEKEKIRLLKNNLRSNILHNNCSGKHIGMIAVCKKCNYDLKTYLSFNHPLQKSILKHIQELSETKEIKIGVDGCSAPTFALSIKNIGNTFSNFTYDNYYSPIVKAMATCPTYVGGENRIDTEIMKASNGKLLSKVGAEGIIIVAYNGNSLVVKIADGNQNIRSFVTVNLLLKLGWLKKKDITDTSLENISSGIIKNLAGKIVGRII